MLAVISEDDISNDRKQMKHYKKLDNVSHDKDHIINIESITIVGIHHFRDGVEEYVERKLRQSPRVVAVENYPTQFANLQAALPRKPKTEMEPILRGAFDHKYALALIDRDWRELEREYGKDGMTELVGELPNHAGTEELIPQEKPAEQLLRECETLREMDEEFHERYVVKRNEKMAQRLAQFSVGGNSQEVMAFIGAAHVPGVATRVAEILSESPSQAEMPEVYDLEDLTEFVVPHEELAEFLTSMPDTNVRSDADLENVVEFVKSLEQNYKRYIASMISSG